MIVYIGFILGNFREISLLEKILKYILIVFFFSFR